MKKAFVYTLAVLFLFVSVAIASPPSKGTDPDPSWDKGNHFGTQWNPGNHYGWGDNGNDNGGACGIGCYKIKAKAFGAGVDCDYKLIPNGAAGGISGAIGGARGGAAGCVFCGSVGGDVDVWAGGITTTDAYRFRVPGTDLSIGVGSESFSLGVTGGELNTHFGGLCGANGGYIKGFTAEGTLNGSYVNESPYFFDSEGFSGGVAGQGAVGGFYGMTGRNGSVGAEVVMSGGSWSDSYRYVNFGDGFKTEGMGTNVGAYTNVNTYGYKEGCGFINGGFIAIGGAATLTVQDAPGIGGAEASAVGFYCGSGNLNTSYDGSAIGYSYTSITMYDGMNGSINSAGAGMSVNSYTD